MNPTGKKLISLFLVFSLMMLAVNLYAKERRGVMLIITKKDGIQYQGELITVKQNSLLILVPSGKDVSVGIEEIMRIEVKTKSNFWKRIVKGGGIGGLIGMGIGVVVGLNSYDPVLTPEQLAPLWGILIGSIGWLAGAIIGAAAGKDETYQVEGMTDSEIQETLDKLRKQARVRDYK